MQKESKLYLGDCLEIMPQFETDSIDAIVTDPPYGISFMGKDWDKAVPSIAIWKECVRVLKPGAFAFVMSIPRQDCLARMICRLEDAGFNVAFSSIYHTFAQGFPKAQNLSKMVDRRMGVERPKTKKIAPRSTLYGDRPWIQKAKNKGEYFVDDDNAITLQAKALDGAYGGFQPKPAVEVVIVAMKPLEEKTYVDQAISNKHGCTWLDDCKIPYDSAHTEDLERGRKRNTYTFYNVKSKIDYKCPNARFPANVLCEDDVLNDGTISKPTERPNLINKIYSAQQPINFYGKETKMFGYPDTGSFSRYFSLDAWFAERIKHLPKEAQKTFPWLIVPKASKSEKKRNNISTPIDNSDAYNGKFPNSKADKEIINKHPTIKPLKLMNWLIILSSREGDVILDPFMGSGTTPLAAKMTNRYYIGIEREKEFFDISVKRINEAQQNMDKFL